MRKHEVWSSSIFKQPHDSWPEFVEIPQHFAQPVEHSSQPSQIHPNSTWQYDSSFLKRNADESREKQAFWSYCIQIHKTQIVQYVYR